LLVVLLTLISLWSLLPCSRGDEERWFGVITAAAEDENGYTVEIEDGGVFNVEWYAGAVTGMSTTK
jgi:hypothetical protein